MSERNVIELELGKPQLLTLEFDSPIEGENRNGKYFGYKCNGGEDILFLPEAGKAAIDRTEAKRGDTIALTKSKNGRNNIWKAELAQSDAPRKQESRAQTATRQQQQLAEHITQSQAQESEVERARRLLAEAEAKEEAAKQQAKPPAETPSQSWPLAEQLLPFLRGACIACGQAEKEAHQNGLPIQFQPEDIRALAITLYIEHRKGGR